MITKELSDKSKTPYNLFFKAVNKIKADYVDESVGFTYYFKEIDGKCYVFAINVNENWYSESIFDFSLKDYVNSIASVNIGRFLNSINTYCDDVMRFIAELKRDVYSDCSLSLMCEYLVMFEHGEDCKVIDFTKEVPYVKTFSPKLTDVQREIIEIIKSRDIKIILDKDMCRVGFIDGSEIDTIYKNHDFDFEHAGENLDLLNDVMWLTCEASVSSSEDKLLYTLKR